MSGWFLLVLSRPKIFKMRTTHLPSLADVAADAAAGAIITDYLTARGVRTVPTLAFVAKTEEELDRHLIQPLFAGFTHGTQKYEVPNQEQPIVQAIMLHMWNTCRQLWASHATPPTTPAATTATAPATSTPKADEKVPKQLPTAVWSTLLQAYNKAQLHGVDRSFPQHEILGAEVILAKMWHEHRTSRMFSPVLLGDIIQRRSFTASGDVNPLSSKAKSSRTLTIEDDQLTYQDEATTWTPRSLLAAIDGLQATKFAMIFVQWGSETSIEKFFAWLVQRARSRPNKMENFNQYFTAISWQLCMNLRQGISFEEASNNIMSDLDKFTEFMARDLVQKIPPKPPNPGGRQKGEKGEKGSGKNRKGKDSWRSNPYRRPWSQDYRQDQHREDQWRSSDKAWDSRQDWDSFDKQPPK